MAIAFLSAERSKDPNRQVELLLFIDLNLVVIYRIESLKINSVTLWIPNLHFVVKSRPNGYKIQK